MKKKILVIGTFFTCILSVIFCGKFKESKSEMLFEELAFVKESNISSIKFYDKKYIYADDVFYDLKGNIKADFSDYRHIEYVNGYTVVEKDNKYGVLGQEFNILIPLEYSNIEIVNERCFLLEKLNRGNTVITNIYNPITKKEYGPYVGVKYYSDELIIVNKYLGSNLDDVTGFMETNKFEGYILNLLKDCVEKNEKLKKYSFVTSEKFQNNYVIASKFVDFQGYRDGVVNNKCDEIVPFFYNSISNIGDKFLLLEKDQTYTLITIDNEVVLPLGKIFDADVDVSLEHEVIVVEKENYGAEYYNYSGELIYKTANIYSYIDYIGDNKYIITDDDKCFLIELLNREVLKEEIDNSYGEDFFGRSENGYIIKDEGKIKKLYNNKLQKVFERTYDDISLYDNFCIVEENGRYKVLSYKEDELTDKEFYNYVPVSKDEVILIDDSYNKYYFAY